jgi:hypothetical protein
MKIFRLNFKVYFLIFMFTILLANCKPLLKAEVDENIPAEHQIIEVRLTYNVEPTTDGKLQITGETNLPEGTKLDVRMRGKSVIYDALSEIKVREGRFRSAEFSLDKRELPLGEYWVTVTMGLSTMQPPLVREIIGKNGEYLSGDIIRRYNDSAATIAVSKHFLLNKDGNITLINKSKPSTDTNSADQ